MLDFVMALLARHARVAGGLPDLSACVAWWA